MCVECCECGATDCKILQCLFQLCVYPDDGDDRDEAIGSAGSWWRLSNPASVYILVVNRCGLSYFAVIVVYRQRPAKLERDKSAGC